jgi:hypothetical protein
MRRLVDISRIKKEQWCNSIFFAFFVINQSIVSLYAEETTGSLVFSSILISPFVLQGMKCVRVPSALHIAFVTFSTLSNYLDYSMSYLRGANGWTQVPG